MPGGHNGPWFHQDTQNRTTSHWAILFLKAYLINNDLVFKKAALKACEYLISDTAMYQGFFHCRNQPGKDPTRSA